MGAAPCKNPKSSEETQKKEDNKKITIGVFGLDNAGKTSTVKAIEGAPTRNVAPTISSATSKVPYPTTGKGDNKSQERVTIIDVSGEKKFRERSWSEYYNQIHGLIFVIDASEKKRIEENKEILKDLLDDRELKNKPILILANKQDRRNAINEEDDIKEKLEIEKLKRKYKIEFCTAIPGTNNKADDSIRQGFSWLIRTIESNYTEINARVHSEKNSHSSRPIDRKPPVKPRQKNDKSDDSESDVVYTNNRKGSPPLNKKTTDYRTGSPPFNKKTTDYRTGSPPFNKKTTDYRTGSPPFNKKTTDYRTGSPPFNKKTTDYRTGSPPFNKKTTDYRTSSPPFNKKTTDYRTNSPPLNKKTTDYRTSSPSLTKKPPDYRSTITSTKLPSIDLNKTKGKSLGNETYDESDDDDRNRSHSRPNISRSDYDNYDRDHSLNQTNGYNKKKKVIGAINQSNNNNTPIKKANSNEPKSFRSSYEPFPEEAPWSSSTNKTTKPDDITSRSYVKSSLTNDPLKRMSPLVNDTKLYNSGSISKRDNFSDNDDDDLYGKQKSKSTPSLTNKPSSTYKKPGIGMYGIDEDDDDLKNKSISRRPNLSTPAMPSTTTKKSYDQYDDDDENDYLKKASSKTTKIYDSDDDNTNKNNMSKTYQRPSDRFNLNSEYRGPTSKPPSSPSLATTSRSKYGDDDRPSSQTKPSIYSKYNDIDQRPLSSSKTSTYPKYNDDYYKSTAKSTSHSKFEDDDRPSSAIKPINRSRYNNDDDDDDYGMSSKPTIRSNYNDNNRSSSPLKTTSRSRYDEDDDYGSSSKPSSRPKFEDDDYDSSLKPLARSKYPNNDTKSTSYSKYEDDDDYRSSPIKTTNRSKFEDDDDYLPSSKKSNYSSRDDDYAGIGNTRSRFTKDDFDSSKSGFNSGRIASASTNRFHSNSKTDT